MSQQSLQRRLSPLVLPTLRRVRFGVAAIVVLPLGCVDDASLPPQALPYRLEATGTRRAPLTPADLDGDGIDELIITAPPETHPALEPRQAVVIRRQTGEAIGQERFAGLVVDISVLDVDRDGPAEILVSFVRHDSLFVTGLDAQARRRFQFFLLAANDQRPTAGSGGWVLSDVDFHVVDEYGGGGRSLVSVVMATDAQRPVGVFVHRLPHGELVDRLLLGPAAPFVHVVEDVDGDGMPELALVTRGDENGVAVGRFEDGRSYFIVVRLQPLRVDYTRELGGRGTWGLLIHEDFDGDGNREWLLGTMLREDKSAALELVEPATRRVFRRRDFARPLNWAVAIDLDGDTRREILVNQPPDSVLLLNGELEVLRGKRFGDGVLGTLVLDDMDGDGIQEILAASGTKLWLLDASLSVMAAVEIDGLGQLPDGRRAALLRTGVGKRAELVLISGERLTTYRLVPNPLWAVHRWRRPALGLLVVLLLGGGIAVLVWLRARARSLAELTDIALDGDADGLMILSSDARILWLSRVLRRWLVKTMEAGPTNLVELEAASPELAAFCGEVIGTTPPRHVEDAGPLPWETDRRAAYTAEPLRAAGGGAREWLVRVRDVAESRELQEARTWTLLAQRIAHDLKNPLTSLLLTLQRMAMEYRSRAPQIADDLDRYTGRMEERIEQLRRMTSNFMKFVEADAPQPRHVSLNALVTAAAERIGQGLPPDIRLTLRLATESPTVHVDPEQLESVLENLAANAVDAMHDGGTITFVTGVHRGRRLVPGADAADWAHLEVLDTGCGIPGDVLDQIFDPSFTSTENGSGLGLTMVRRIVQGHGGRIFVESEPGTGSAFSVHLPLATAEGVADDRPVDHESGADLVDSAQVR